MPRVTPFSHACTLTSRSPFSRFLHTPSLALISTLKPSILANMHFIDCTHHSTANSSHLTAAAALLETAFPLEERPHTEAWLARRTSHKNFHILALCKHNNFCGFLSYWDFHSFIYIEHFAILPSQRGNKLGSHALTAFKNLHPQTPLVLEAEPAHYNDFATRRLNFYKRHDFHIQPYAYVQPPYHQPNTPLPLHFLSTHPLAPHDFDTYKAQIYKEVYAFTP